MATITFDTLKAVEGLEAAGMDARHAKAVVNTVAEAFSDTVATKSDIADLKAEMANIRADMSNLKAEMFRALWIQGGSIVALIVGLLKFT